MWDAAAQHTAPALWRDVPVHEAPLALPAAHEGEEIVFDYAATGLTLRRHPLALLRPRLARWRLQTALQLHSAPNGRKVRACGIVTVRQRPGTAKGTMFVTLEDETGPVNVIVWPALVEHWRMRCSVATAGGGGRVAVQPPWARRPGRGAPPGGPAFQRPHAPAGAHGAGVAGQPGFSLSGPGQPNLQLPEAATRRFPMHAATLSRSVKPLILGCFNWLVRG
jgi:hypothetical protein